MKSYLQGLSIAVPGAPKTDGPIVPEPPLNEHPYPLPAGFEWGILDLTNDKEVHELYILLRDNYVEDVNSAFRFDYSPEFLKWCLTTPGWRPELNVSLRYKGELVGYMNSTPSSIRIEKKILTMGVGDFLCIHKRFRGHRLTPLVVMEQIRRSHLAGIYQAVATCGAKHVCQELQSYNFYHRPLNIQKLVKNDFWFLDAGQSMTDLEKMMSTRNPGNLKGLRLMEKKDIPETMKLLNKYLKKTRLAPNFSAETFAHQFLPRENVVYSYVVEQNDKITDFVSVYLIPTTVISSGVILNIAYVYYSASGRLTKLIEHLLPVLKELKIDCLNALNFGQHDKFIKKLNFQLGTGTLHYYLYNWNFSKKFSKSDISLTLL